MLLEGVLAERVGFEPTLEFPLNTLSKRAPSTTRPSLLRSEVNPVGRLQFSIRGSVVRPQEGLRGRVFGVQENVAVQIVAALQEHDLGGAVRVVVAGVE